MIHRISILACLSIGLSVASAQQAHHSEVIIGHRGVDALKADFRYLLSLTTPQEQAQEENLVGFIELMELGVDLEKAIRVDVLTGTNPPTYVVSAGYAPPLEDLMANLDGAGFVLKDSGPNLWEILPPDKGWLRVLPEAKTAILVFDKESDHSLLKQIILKMSAPLPAVQPLLSDGANVAVSLTNTAKTPADQLLRKNSFGEIRAVQLDTLQKRPSETQTQFQIRKQLMENQLNEIERLLVEADSASAKAMLNKEQGTARVAFDATAIAETSFAATLAEFGKTPDLFASIPKAPESVLSIRGNHPVDVMRQGHANSLLALIKQDAVERVQKNASLSDSEKAASEKFFDGIYQVSKDTIATGNLNGFLESVQKGDDEFLSYGAINVKDGLRLNEILPLIADTGKNNSFKPAVAKVGDVTIHEITLAKGYFEPFDMIFDGKTGFVGTSADVVWFGTGGPEALEPLKASIESLGDPAENDTVLTIEGRLLPWAKRARRILAAEPEPATATEQTQRRDQLRNLGLAVEAFASEDSASFSMKVADGKATGEILVNTGVLRFIGKAMASYSKTNLE